MGIILRNFKGSELTYTEVDDNFKSLYYSSSLDGSVLEFFFTASGVSHSIDLTGLGQIQVENDGVVVETNAGTLNFQGEGIANVYPEGGGAVAIEIEGFPFTGSAQITGSLIVTGSVGIDLDGGDFIITPLPFQDVPQVVTYDT